MVDAEERRDSALQDTLRNIFNKFDQKYVQFSLSLSLSLSLSNSNLYYSNIIFGFKDFWNFYKKLFYKKLLQITVY